MQEKRLAILKTGGTMPGLAARLGDFEDWTARGLGLDDTMIRVIDARTETGLPDVTGLAGVVVTGSHDMVTDRHEWSERAAAWLALCVTSGIPVLGICYGHQLLAYAMGGAVADNPAGREFGTRTVDLLPAAEEDPLLHGCGSGIRVHLCHTQSVTSLPPGAVRLASSHMDPNQAFRLGKNAWGVQFHPEFSAEAVREYIREYKKVLAIQGEDPALMETECCDTPFGDTILGRFASWCFSKTLPPEDLNEVTELPRTGGIIRERSRILRVCPSGDRE